MVIQLVAHGDLFLHKLPEPLAVDVYPRRRGRRSIPDDLGQTTQESGRAETEGRIAILIHVVEKELCVLMALFCRLGKLIFGYGAVLFHLLSQEVQLSQKVLGLYAALLGSIGEALHCFSRVLFYLGALKIELTQLVAGKLIAALRRLLIPRYRLTNPVTADLKL